MLKRILIAALLWPLVALGQSYPSPTYQNLTINGKFGMSSLGSSVHNAYNIGSTVIPAFSQLRASSAGTTSGTLNSSVGTDGVDASEFLTFIESNQAPTSNPQAATNSATASGNNVLHFASVPTGVAAAMQITDLTNLSAIPSGTTVSSVGSGTVTMNRDASGTGVGSGDTISFGFPYFKGPLFTAAMASDNMYGSITKFSDGFVSYATIAAGITSGWAEAMVALAEDTTSGDGTLIGAEIDIGPTHTTNSAHCDTITSTVSNCHTNLWLSNTGSQNGSWVMDTGNGGAGWNNGISLRFIASGGTALAVPNNTLLTGATTGGGAVTLAQVDTSNILQIGASAASINLNAALVGSTAGFTGESISQPAGNTRSIQFQSSGISRWQLRVDNSAESGSNAGSNFNIDRYNDAGSFQDSPINISRASGNVTIADGLIVSGTIAPSQTAGILGTTTNNNASAGSVGETITSNVLRASAVSLTTNTPANVTSISLTAGDWDVSGQVILTPNASTTITQVSAWISTTSASLPSDSDPTKPWFFQSGSFTTGNGVAMQVTRTRLSLSATTTVFLSTQNTFGVSTMTGCGFIQARRVR
jgi:hypothetical protein